MICLLSTIVIQTSLALAPIPSTAPSAQESRHGPHKADALEGRARAEVDCAGLPRREVDSIAKVLHFARSGKQLIAQPVMEDLPQMTRLIIGDVSGVVTMTVFPPPPPDVHTPRDFSYKQCDFDGTGDVARESITSVAVAGGRLTIARDVGNADATISVQLLCNPFATAPDATEPAVTLYISRRGENNAAGDFEIKRTAESFRDLRLQFPGDVDKYFRPILRQFKQEALVFAPDPKIAWQVLMEDWQPDAATVEKVKSIAARLDAEDFQRRSAAQSELLQIGQPAAVILYRMDRAKLSPETQSAIDSILESYIQLTADDVKSMRDDPAFLLDALSTDDAALRKLAWQRLQSITHTIEPFDPNADAPTRAAAIAKVAESMRKQ